MFSRISIASSILGLLFTASCTPGTQYNIYIDPGFSPENSNIITGGANEWAEVVPVSFKFNSDMIDCSSNAHSICVHSSTKAEVEQEAHDTSRMSTTFYHTYNDSSDIYIATDLLEKIKEEFRVTVIHEFGHAQAMSHTGPGSIMNWNYADAARHPTCVDILQWSEVRGMKIVCDPTGKVVEK